MLPPSFLRMGSTRNNGNHKCKRRPFDKKILVGSGEVSPKFGHANAIIFCVYRPYKESISKEMNNDNVIKSA